MGTESGYLPTIENAVESFFNEFDFGEEGRRTRLSYETGARNFLRFIKEKDDLELDMPINILPSTISDDFKNWMLTANNSRPGITGRDSNREILQGFSPATRILYAHSLSRLLRYWSYRDWLQFSPCKEEATRKALQIQRKRKGRFQVHSRSEKVPVDFGDKMVQAASSLLLPTEKDIPNSNERRKARLNVFRIRALIHTLRDTALRVGDICSLSRSDIELVHQSGGYLRVLMAKTNLAAHVVFGNKTLSVIDAYIKERADESPWVFIQHGRTGNPARKSELSAEHYRRKKRGYGARFGSGSIRNCIIELARIAGYDPESDRFISTHAFRHWHAKRLIAIGASTDDVQIILGHAFLDTTKDMYATDPNIEKIREWAEKI